MIVRIAGEICVEAAGTLRAVEETLTAIGSNGGELLGAVTCGTVNRGATVAIWALGGMVTATGFNGLGLIGAVTDGEVDGFGVWGLLRACSSWRRRLIFTLCALYSSRIARTRAALYD